MYRQNDPEVNMLGRFGCYFFSILYLDQKVSGKEYTPIEINKVWFKNWNDGDMDVETTILNPNGLCKDLSGQLEFVGKYPASYKVGLGEYEILRFVRKSDGYVHFVVGDGNNKVEFDPWENSRTVREGYIESKRIYRVKS
jgi:hypothetical protein